MALKRTPAIPLWLCVVAWVLAVTSWLLWLVHFWVGMPAGLKNLGDKGSIGFTLAAICSTLGIVQQRRVSSAENK